MCVFVLRISVMHNACIVLLCSFVCYTVLDLIRRMCMKRYEQLSGTLPSSVLIGLSNHGQHWYGFTIQH